MLFSILLCSCARQGAIPNTDRFPPHLLSADSPNRTEVRLTFDEGLNPSGLLETFKLESNSDTPEIKFITSVPGNSKILTLFTSPLEPHHYEISGLVVDGNNNAASIRSKFKASEKMDTTPPSMVISPADTQASFPFRLSMSSNEPIDTSRNYRVITIPYSSSTSLSWRPDLSRIDINTRDTSLKTQPFYLIIFPGISDFAGNRVKHGLSSFIYADSLTKLSILHGIAKSEELRPSGCMLILLKMSERILAATLADSSGYFTISYVPTDSLGIEAWCDYNGDGLFEESGNERFAPLPDSIEISTQKLSSPRFLEQIIPEGE